MTLPAATSSRATTLAILALAGVTLDTRLHSDNDAADPHRVRALVDATVATLGTPWT